MNILAGSIRFNKMAKKEVKYCDIVIIGGGLVGLTAACAIADLGLEVVIVEHKDLSKIKSKESDGRSSAIAYGSYIFLKEIGVWDHLKNKAGPMLEIRVSDGDSHMFLHYDHKLVGEDPVGYMVENHDILKALVAKCNEYDNIAIYENTSYSNINYGKDFVKISLNSGSVLSARLLIGADGRQSKIRENAGIGISVHEYKQCGIVCNVKHEKPHRNIAQERFLPSGPFAILPLKDQNKSSLVWTEKKHLTPTYINMSDEDFNEQLYKRFGGYLGKVSIIGKRFSYPLTLVLAEKYTANRLVLLGDAAHGIHPLAGQGFNLGIRDCNKLVEVIARREKLGLDIGSTELLAQYNDTRYTDTFSLAAITHNLNSIFCSNSVAIKIARRVGMSVLDKVPPVKKFFMKHAMGMKS